MLNASFVLFCFLAECVLFSLARKRWDCCVFEQIQKQFHKVKFETKLLICLTISSLISICIRAHIWCDCVCVFSCEMCLVGDYRWHVRLRLNWYHQDISRMKLLGRIAIVIKLNWMKKKKICLILMCMWILYTTLTHIVMQNERYKADRIEPLWRKMMQLVMFGSITWKANTNGS